MISASSSILLLGWDDASRAGAPDRQPSLPALVQALAPHGPVSVMLLRPLASPLAAAPGVRVTSLASLTAAEARAPRPRPDQRPAAWQRPTAPYTGTADAGRPAGSAGSWMAPAAPYLGASVVSQAPGLAAEPGGVLNAEISIEPQTPALPPEPVTQPAAGSLLNHDEFAGEAAEPDTGEAHDLTQPADDLNPDQAATPTPPAQATLPDALAALAANQLPTADLNYQVIQYARFATRRALLEEFAVIYAPDWLAWLAALEIRQQTGRPLVLHVHSLAQDRATPADRGWALELERLALRRADLVLAASEEVAQRLHTRYQLAPDRLQVVLPTDTATLHATLRRLDTGQPGRPLSAPFFSPTA